MIYKMFKNETDSIFCKDMCLTVVLGLLYFVFNRLYKVLINPFFLNDLKRFVRFIESDYIMCRRMKSWFNGVLYLRAQRWKISSYQIIRLLFKLNIMRIRCN